ncbi:MAG: hypothetical protein ACJ8FV_03110 [Xanthobacteraceae bacterium]
MPKMRLLWPCVVALLTGFAAPGAYGQQDLDAGKTGPQLFAQDCAACHRSPQGLSKTLSGGSLVSFLRQHYTSSSTSAGVVAGYLLAAGANVRGERQKGQPAEEAKQSGQPRERSKPARPGETAPIPPAPVPSAGPPAPAPRQQHERIARPTDVTVDRHGQPSRKLRRPRPGEPTAAPATPEAAPAAPAAEPSTAAAAVRPAAASGSDASPDGAKEPTARAATPAAPSGFAEPLP